MAAQTAPLAAPSPAPPPASAPGPAPYLRVGALGRSYGGRWAVRGVSFEVRRGEIVGLIGPNGAGKTTTLKMLAGILAPTEGAATAGALAVTDPRHRARLGYLPEESPLYEEMTPLAYLRFFGDLYGVPRDAAAARIEAALALLDLEVRGGKRIGDLSKGMRRKVAIARSLVNDPDLLLWDEPASGLDPVVSESVLGLLQRLRAAGKAIVLSAHNLFHLERMCDRVLILRQGQVVAHGTMAELRAAAGGGYVVRLSAPVPGAVPGREGHEAVVATMAEVEELERMARAAGGGLLGVAPRELSLEEIFLRRVAR